MNASTRFSILFNRASIVGLVGCVAALVWFSLHLAGSRIYQVDECCNVYVARQLAAGQGPHLSGVDLFQLVLSVFDRGATRSADLYSSARFIMLEIFWLNIVLIAIATGEKLLSLRGLVALAGAATLAPLWDFGFEARHDNLILTGLLVMWCAMRVQPRGVQSFAVGGGIAVALQFIAFKSFVYTVPMLMLLILAPIETQAIERWKRAVACLAGAGVTAVIVGLIYLRKGLWNGDIAGGHGFAAVAGGGHRFGPTLALIRFVTQAPLVIALSTASCIAILAQFKRSGKTALAWNGYLPEALLLGIALAALLANPTPFQYNLLNLVPFAYLLGFRYAVHLLPQTQSSPVLIPVCLTLIVFTHLVPFSSATRRHLDYPNTRQVSLMQRAEDLTDPAKDPVYDAIGLVPTRRMDPAGFLHSLTIESLTKGPGPQIRDLLAADPAAVLIPSYRTDWLPKLDHDFIEQHYVPLADDFWVLGKVLSTGGGTFDIIHEGRYRISSESGSDLAGTYPEGLQQLFTPEVDGCLNGSIDGIALSDRPMNLTKGPHRIECASDQKIAVVWVGPHVDRVHRIGVRDHRYLFVNGY